MLSEHELHVKRFENRDALATDLAASIANTLEPSISKNASIAVSGGSTPKVLFEALSKTELDWSQVTITLVDDRCVPSDHERSNEKLVRDHLMQNHASNAVFSPLQGVDENAMREIMPFDVCVLGMGNDGHTASFFPKGDTLAQAVNLAQSELTISLEAEGAGEPRVTLTLPAILSAKRVILHIEGSQKWDVLQEALSDGPPEDMPIRYVLAACPNIEIYWAA